MFHVEHFLKNKNLELEKIKLLNYKTESNFIEKFRYHISDAV